MVPNSISGIVSSVDWPENITDQFGKMSSQSDTGTNLLPDPHGFIRIRFQINCLFVFRKSVRILFTDRALLTIRRMDKVLGKVSPSSYSQKIMVVYRELPTIRRMDKFLGKVSKSPYSPKITVAYGELRIYFAVQIPPFSDWT